MKQKLITDYLIQNQQNIQISIPIQNPNLLVDNINKIYGFNPETGSWHCLECGIDMGQTNPRQLCKKTYCGRI